MKENFNKNFTSISIILKITLDQDVIFGLFSCKGKFRYTYLQNVQMH